MLAGPRASGAALFRNGDKNATWTTSQLCLSLYHPFIVMLVEGPRSLRVPIAYQSIGIVLFIAIAGAIWTLGGRAIRAGTL